jgi:hypothetical protein
MLAGRGWGRRGQRRRTPGYLKVGAARVLRRQQVDLGRVRSKSRCGPARSLAATATSRLTRTRFLGNIATSASPAARARDDRDAVHPRGVVCRHRSVATPRARGSPCGSALPRTCAGRTPRIGHNVVGFDELPGQFEAYLKGGVIGRTVVRIGEAWKSV